MSYQAFQLTQFKNCSVYIRRNVSDTRDLTLDFEDIWFHFYKRRDHNEPLDRATYNKQ